MTNILRRSSANVLVIAGSLLFAINAFALDSVKFMIPANPGGGWDQTGRNLAKAMQESNIVKNIQFDNKGGAGGTIGLAQFVNTAKGDGHAIMVGGMVMVGGIILNKSPVTLAQVTPLARLTGEYEVIVVPANSELKTFADLIAKLKANPGSVSWGGGSAGGTDHILAGLIAQAVGVDPAKVNYIAYAGGGETVGAILGGHVTLGVAGYGEFATHITSGKMRPLAISSDTRVPGINIPTMKEQGVNVDLFNWRGVFGAPGISDAQKAELLKALDATVKSKSWQDTLKRMDWSDIYQSGDDFKKYVDDENKRIGDILAKLNLKK